MPRSRAYVDESGETLEADEIEAAESAPGRGSVPIELDGGAVAVITYDATLISDPEPVRTAGRVIAIAADRERLIAELRANRSELRESRERVLDARDQERERLAQDLHDGLQVQLVLLAINAQQLAGEPATPEPVAARATQLRKEIDAAAADLRRLAHAVMPAALVQHGLAAATEDLVDRMPITTTLELGIEDGECSAAVERTAYFIVAEALTNAIKHSQATRASVRLVRVDGLLTIEVEDDGVGGAALRGGSGLRGLADRVDVLGGRMQLTSEPGDGTRIFVELPCES
jgi:signal transduction histidine kinase